MDVLMGKVIHNPVLQDNICIYEAQVENRNYNVISKDYQAVKDNIFINSGQTVEILGDIIEDTIYTKKSRIILER